jgi:hypothetical protein
MEPPRSSASAIYRQLRQDLLVVENGELDQLRCAGDISDGTRRWIPILNQPVFWAENNLIFVRTVGA